MNYYFTSFYYIFNFILRYKISNNYDWVAFYDFDEFLILTKDKNIKEYLSRDCFKYANQILINWKTYTDNDLVYTLEYSPKPNYARSIYKPQNKIGKVIRDFFIMDKVFYQDNSVGNAIQNYLDLAKKL